MASPDVVASVILLSITLLSLLALLYNSLGHRSTSTKVAIFLLLAIVSAVSGATALGVACGEPLRVVARVFVNLLNAALSGVSIYALSPSSQTPAFPPPFLRFFLSLVGLLVACELASALIPTSPPLLPAMLALVSRGILLFLSMATAIRLRQTYATASIEVDTEKGCTANDSPGKTPAGRVSSPTQATWPFPGSLAMQDQSELPGCHGNTLNRSDLLPSLTLARTHNVDEYTIDKRIHISPPVMLTITQMFAIFPAALHVAAGTLANSVDAIEHTHPGILLACAACTLLWSIMVIATIQTLPAVPKLHALERRVTSGCEHRGDYCGLSRDNPGTRAQKPSLCRRESDSLLDFLSLRDPFASLPPPPPPPPVPPVGLGLDEVDVGWSGNREIGMQYRFPAPRSIAKGGKCRSKMVRVNGKKCLVHQDSARTLLPVPETRGTELDASGDKGFGDEVRLAQLLLQSLNEGCEDYDSPGTSTPVPAVQPPQAAHIPQISRWSTSTTVQSIMSASVSNRSGVSTYTTCASEKVPTNRISMNTVASAFGSRKSSEARRKSVMTACSLKG